MRGRTIDLTPDEKFNKFCALTVSLPDNSKTWPIQLCSLFLGALTSELADHITTESSFSIPDLTTLTTKSSQLDALRSIRFYASKSFEILNKQKEKMEKIIQGMHRGHQYNCQCSKYSSNTNGQSYFQSSPSLAESTITRNSRE